MAAVTHHLTETYTRNGVTFDVACEDRSRCPLWCRKCCEAIPPAHRLPGSPRDYGLTHLWGTCHRCLNGGDLYCARAWRLALTGAGDAYRGPVVSASHEIDVDEDGTWTYV